MAGSLDQPLAKLERAASHYRAIKYEIFGGADREDWAGTLERYRNGLEYRVRAGEIKPLPAELPLVFGDAYFNLRAALDYLVYQMHVRHYRSDTFIPQGVVRASAFPILRTQPTGKNGIPLPTSKWKEIGNLAKRERTAIDWIQPYQRRGDRITKQIRMALADIGTLNNIDKHRELHLGRSILLAVQAPSFAPESGFQQHPSFGVTLKTGAYIDTWTFTTPPPPEQMNIKPLFTTAVGIEPGGDRIEAVAHLGGCILAVERVIHRFAHLFPPPPSAPDLSWVHMNQLRR
jgi:hypothetical protein